MSEAKELLRIARAGGTVEASRAERFARAVIEATPLGRKALAVLSGGLFVGTRVVELAEEVADGSVVRAGGGSAGGR